MEVDIIEFKVPYENNKALFVWGIQPTFTEAFIYESVSKVFETFGPLYLLKVCPNAAVAEPGFYALIKFFSAAQASKAQRATHGRTLFQTSPLKVSLSTKQTPSFQTYPSLGNPLSHSKCQYLANTYLGFNGWSTHIVTLKDLSSGAQQEGLPAPGPGPSLQEGLPAPGPGPSLQEGLPAPGPGPSLQEGLPAPGPGPSLQEGLPAPGPGPSLQEGLPARGPGPSLQERCLRYGCMVEITFPKHGLSSRGMAVTEETFHVTSPEVVLQKSGKLQKWARDKAVVQAFEKVLLLLLGNGKVMVEVRVDRDEVLPDQHLEGLVQVNEVPWSQFDPEKDEEEQKEALEWELTVNM